MKNLKRSIIAGIFALCLMVGASYATSASYNTRAIGIDKTYATGTKSNTNNTSYNHVQQAAAKIRCWVDGKPGSTFQKVTNHYDFSPGQSRHMGYTSTPRVGSTMHLRGRCLVLSASGNTIKGYVDFN